MVRIPVDIETMQEAMVRAHLLERREPGAGRWPFAGDAPWHLMQRDHVDDMPNVDVSTMLIETDGGQQLEVRKVESREPRVPLSAAEVDELAMLRRWLQQVPDVVAYASGGGGGQVSGLRRLVWVAAGRLASGEGRMPWTALGKWMGWAVDRKTVELRYKRALALGVARLHGKGEAVVRQLLRGEGLVADPRPAGRVRTFQGDLPEPVEVFLRYPALPDRERDAG